MISFATRDHPARSPAGSGIASGPTAHDPIAVVCDCPLQFPSEIHYRQFGCHQCGTRVMEPKIKRNIQIGGSIFFIALAYILGSILVGENLLFLAVAGIVLCIFSTEEFDRMGVLYFLFLVLIIGFNCALHLNGSANRSIPNVFWVPALCAGQVIIFMSAFEFIHKNYCVRSSN